MKSNPQHDSVAEIIVKKPQVVLFGSDSTLLEKLHSAALPFISYEVGFGPQVAAKARLYAFWATLMVGVELFGAAPPFPLHEARVLETPTAQRQKGFPKYAIVGVAVSENDPKEPEYNLRLVMSSLLQAVRDFNARSQDRIVRIGVLPDDLELKRLRPEAAFEIIRDVYERA